MKIRITIAQERQMRALPTLTEKKAFLRSLADPREDAHHVQKSPSTLKQQKRVFKMC